MNTGAGLDAGPVDWSNGGLILCRKRVSIRRGDAMGLRRVLVGTVALLGLALPAGAAEGVRPVGADGRKLNLGFEDGTFTDWTVEGDAFGARPVQGDAVFARRGDMRSGHAGGFWAGSF